MAKRVAEKAGLQLVDTGAIYRSVAMLALLAVWGFLGTAAQVARWAWVTQVCVDDVEAGGGLLVAVAQIGITGGSFLGGTAYDQMIRTDLNDPATGRTVCIARSVVRRFEAREVGEP